MLAYARETVARRRPAARQRQRVRWWSALALLRSLASSPAAAAATLRTRAADADAETPEEADEIGRRTVLDLDDDEAAEGADVAPGADPTARTTTARPRPRAGCCELAREAEALRGDKRREAPEGRPARRGAARRRLPARSSSAASSRPPSTSPTQLREPARRASRSSPSPARCRRPSARRASPQLGERHEAGAGRTDCLSEGINLQELFDAVVHYDLSWNPTRHEQREGRVDRFGQPSPRSGSSPTTASTTRSTASCSTCCSASTRRSAARSASRSRCRSTRNAGHRGDPRGAAAARARRRPSSALLDASTTSSRSATSCSSEWEAAAEREKRSRTLFAQQTIKAEEVVRELEAVRAAIGSGVDVARFVRDALRRSRRDGRRNGDAVRRRPRRDARAAARRCSATAGDEFRARFELPVADGDALPEPHPPAGRGARRLTCSTPPSTRSATGVGPPLRRDPHRRGRRGARRCCWSGSASTSSPGRGDGERPLLAEDARLARLRRRAAERRVARRRTRPRRCSTPSPRRTSRPTRPPTSCAGSSTASTRLRPHLDDVAPSGAARSCSTPTAASARRAGAKGVSHRVEPQLPADVLGVYVYLPGSEESADAAAQRRPLHDRPHRGGAPARPTCSQRVAAGDASLDGLTPDAYHLVAGERLNEAITRSWNRLLGAWAAFRDGARRSSPSGDPATTLDPRALAAAAVRRSSATAGCTPARPVEIDGKTYPVSHAWQHAPIHLVGCRRRPRPPHAGRGRRGTAQPARPGAGAAEPLRRAPLGVRHATGCSCAAARQRPPDPPGVRRVRPRGDVRRRGLRRLRPALAALPPVPRRGRAARASAGSSAGRRPPQEQGTRALDQLRDGVEEAIEALGAGSSPTRPTRELRDAAARRASSTPQDYYRQLLRLVYRLLFLFVAEDRDLLLDPRRRRGGPRALRALLLDGPPAAAGRAPARHAARRPVRRRCSS